VYVVSAAILPVQTRHDWVIVPSVRVGPITASSSEADLRKAFGAAWVVDKEIDFGEGMFDPGTLIYEKVPGKTLAIRWKDPASRMAPEWFSICYAQPGVDCGWRTADGIGTGTALKDLERRNGGSFTLAGFGWDYSGTVVDWEGGKLGVLKKGPGRLILRLDAPHASAADYKAVRGDAIFSSSHPVMQKLNPRVYSMDFEFSR